MTSRNPRDIPAEHRVPLEQGEMNLPEMPNGFPPGFGPNAGGIPGAYGAPIPQQMPPVQQYAPGPYPPPVQMAPGYYQQGAQPLPPMQGQPMAYEEAPSDPEPGLWKYPNSIDESLFEDPEDVPTDISAFYPEGVTQEQVNQWKQMYKEVYFVIVMGRAWFYRPLTRNEYLAIMAQRQDQFMNEEAICAAALIWPRVGVLELRADSAGIASSISDYVMKMSGFAPTSIPVKL